MKHMKDLREIHDLPNLEDYTGLTFDLVLYERGDEMQIWEHITFDTDGKRYVIDMSSDEQLINGSDNFWEIVTQEKIHYFCFSIYDRNDNLINQWDYRPLIPDNNKNFID